MHGFEARERTLHPVGPLHEALHISRTAAARAAINTEGGNLGGDGIDSEMIKRPRGSSKQQALTNRSAIYPVDQA